MNLAAGLPATGPKSNEFRDSEASVPDQVSLLKKLYTLQQIELFSELHFEWKSYEAKEDEAENLINLDGDEEPKTRKTGEAIPCCVGSPPISFVSRPLQVRIRNLREI